MVLEDHVLDSHHSMIYHNQHKLEIAKTMISRVHITPNTSPFFIQYSYGTVNKKGNEQVVRARECS